MGLMPSWETRRFWEASVFPAPTVLPTASISSRLIAQDVKGNADLVVYFFLRSCSIARSVGLLATNSVSQGPRELADRLVERLAIHRA